MIASRDRNHSAGKTGLSGDRVLGALVAGAFGDACGGPYEGGAPRWPVATPARMVLSDDTQFTLATCESILACGRVDPAEIASHMLQWYVSGRVRGIGSSTLKAMRDLAAGTHWAVSGARGEYAAGNGAAMRIAPLAFLLDPAKDDDRTLIRDVCRITHHHDEAYVGALAAVVAIQVAAAEMWRDRGLLSVVAEALPDSGVRDRVLQLAGMSSPVRDVAARFGASGHVVESIPLALYCGQLVRDMPVAEVLSQAISCGGDTDTIASIAGQIAGASVGIAGVPADLLTDVEGGPEAKAIFEQFATIAGRG